MIFAIKLNIFDESPIQLIETGKRGKKRNENNNTTNEEGTTSKNKYKEEKEKVN